MSFKHLLVLLIAAIPVAFAGPAFAQGGAAAPGAPAPREAECLESPGAACTGSKLLRGRTFVVRGSKLENVTRIAFLGRPTKRDDVSAGAVKRSGRYVVAVVPSEAASGRLKLIDRWGASATTGFRVSVQRRSQAQAARPVAGFALFLRRPAAAELHDRASRPRAAAERDDQRDRALVGCAGSAGTAGRGQVGRQGRRRGGPHRCLSLPGRRRGQRRVGRRPVLLRRPPLPDPWPPRSGPDRDQQLRRGPRPPGAGHVRPLRHQAGARSRRQGPVRGIPRAPPATTWWWTPRARASTTSTCTCARLRW